MIILDYHHWHLNLIKPLKNFIDSIAKFLHFFFSAKATYAAIAETYSYLTPDLWKETVFTKSPYQVFCPLLHMINI